MSTKLPNYLWPKGRSTTEPDLMPNVKDSDGNAVLFTSAKRKTTEGTVVDLGDSPNSNNGDPLRTAFAKVNNFIEAAYWWDEGINQKFRDIDSELNEGVSFYSDSDERYSVSLTGDSKFYFRGTPNQIETSFSRKKSANNPNDWDSEVNLNFKLASTLEVNTVNINEFFNIKDSDGNIRVSYSTVDYPTTHDERARTTPDSLLNIGTNVVLGRDSDDVVVVNSRIMSNLIPYGDEIYNLGDSDNKWRDLWLSGNTIHLGSIQIKNLNNRGLVLVDSDGQTLDLTIHSGRAATLRVDSDMSVDGLTRLLGDLTVRQNARFDSDVRITGNLIVDDHSTLSGHVRMLEGLTVDSDVFLSADLQVDSDLIVKGTSVFGQQMVINDTLNVSGHATFDSDMTISGTVTASSFKTTNPAGLTFEDDVVFQGHATFDSDVTIKQTLTVDSDVIIKGQLTVSQEVTFNDDVVFNDNVQIDSDVSITGGLTVGREATFSDDVIFRDNARFDSDISVAGGLTVGREATFSDDVIFRDNAQFDSDVSIAGGLTVGREATFNDDVVFYDNVIFDSDVLVRGSFTVNGTANFLNPNQLQVSDNLIVLNYGQPTPFNDTGIIFSRYDSDSVSAANWNVKLMWDESQDQIVIGQTSSSGILPNPDTTQTYLEVGNTVELFDSDNNTRMVWDKDQARLSILNKDGTEAFAFDADSGQMEGNGTIDAGLF